MLTNESFDVSDNNGRLVAVSIIDLLYRVFRIDVGVGLNCWYCCCLNTVVVLAAVVVNCCVVADFACVVVVLLTDFAQLLLVDVVCVWYLLPLSPTTIAFPDFLCLSPPSLPKILSSVWMALHSMLLGPEGDSKSQLLSPRLMAEQLFSRLNAAELLLLKPPLFGLMDKLDIDLDSHCLNLLRADLNEVSKLVITSFLLSSFFVFSSLLLFLWLSLSILSLDLLETSSIVDLLRLSLLVLCWLSVVVISEVLRAKSLSEFSFSSLLYNFFISRNCCRRWAKLLLKLVGVKTVNSELLSRENDDVDRVEDLEIDELLLISRMSDLGVVELFEVLIFILSSWSCFVAMLGVDLAGYAVDSGRNLALASKKGLLLLLFSLSDFKRSLKQTLSRFIFDIFLGLGVGGICWLICCWVLLALVGVDDTKHGDILGDACVELDESMEHDSVVSNPESIEFFLSTDSRFLSGVLLL